MSALDRDEALLRLRILTKAPDLGLLDRGAISWALAILEAATPNEAQAAETTDQVRRMRHYLNNFPWHSLSTHGQRVAGGALLPFFVTLGVTTPDLVAAIAPYCQELLDAVHDQVPGAAEAIDELRRRR